MMGVILVQAGLGLAAVGLLATVRPVRRLGLGTRRAGALVLAAGAVLGLTGALLPAPANRVDATRWRLDEFAPSWQFAERHSIRVAARPERAWAAVREVTADEIAFFRTLTWLRRLGRPGPESILQAPGGQPLLDVATRTSFLLLAEEPPREIVVGTLVLAPPGFRVTGRPTPDDYRRLEAPGFVKAVMGFRVEPDGAGSVVTTETRVFATDAASRRRFAVYWRIIYPGSASIRRMWLRAIRSRAERRVAPPPGP
jgi:hypothetical protein